MLAKRILAFLLFAAAAGFTTAQTPPMSSEIPVNTYTTNVQSIRAGVSAIDQFGNFILVWESLGQDGGSNGVYGQRFDSAGAPLGPEFPINTYTTSNQDRAVVAADKNGDFVVAWQSLGQDGYGYGIFARRYDADGTAGAEFLVNTYTSGTQRQPAIAMNAAGRFVVVWWDADARDGDADGVFGQVFDDNGSAVGGDFPVNTFTTGAQRYPAVAMNGTGEFVVAWESAGSDGDGYGISARRFDASGAPITGEIPVNAFTTGDQRLPAVGTDGDGNFVVVWESQNVDGSGTGVVGRRFDASGSPTTGEFAVNTYTTNFQGTPSLSMDRDGNFVVGWQSGTGPDGDLSGVFARAYDASCNPGTPEFLVNVITTSNQTYPAVALNDSGQFVIGWESTYPEPNGDIVARTSAPQAFPAVVDAHAAGTGTSDLNGVLEAGETVVIEPAYKNNLAGAFSLTAIAGNLSGPPGPGYVLQDGTADYGTIAAGATNGCFSATSDCYVATVSGARPAPHWDARLDELLSTGITKSWEIHIGESFPDVPRSQQFYRFIETLFHNSITGGCGGGNYCPTNSVTRAQMAVFLLKSKHDALYTPPACAGVFGDVTCPSQFADWIEQLAAEGITGGCGGGNYCPDNPVTRAQMAVFLLKAEHGSAYVPPACTGVFGDVACPSQFADWIEQLAVEQITGGCGGGNYCPGNPNTRGQMAVFLVKTFGLQLYGP